MVSLIAGCSCATVQQGPVTSQPTVTLVSVPGFPKHIVYVVDQSGSMLNSFDLVRRDMERSISGLRSAQDFHIILFSSTRPDHTVLEIGEMRLVPATPENKAKANKFLRDVVCESTSDPLPALERAFDVLDKVDPYKIILIVTDGNFPDDQKVLDLIARRNTDKKVNIITRLCGEPGPRAIQIMQQIAGENGGHFKMISKEE